MHRFTAHILRADVTGIQGGTIQKGHQQQRHISHFQYRMLDTRNDGLFSKQVLDLILQHLRAEDRPNARRVLDLAMKGRNALAHGALTQSDEYTLDGLGHIFAKATQTLVTAGLHHFTQESAYFIYHNQHPNLDGRDTEDWFQAEREVLTRISQIAQEVPMVY